MRVANADVLLFNISSFIAGLFLLEYGADKFIDHTAIVAKRLNVSPTLIGLLTCGAEWEELVVVIVALGQKNSNLALGNIIGSSIANILSSFSLGLLVIGKAEFDRSSKIYTTLLLAATSLFLGLLATVKTVPTWITGSLLTLIFAVYVASVATLIYQGTLTAPENDSDSESDSDDDDSDSDSDNDSASTNPNISTRQTTLPTTHPVPNEEQPLLHPPPPAVSPLPPAKPQPHKPNRKPLLTHLLHLTLGLAALLIASYVLAHSASTLGRELSLSSTVVGTTLLSLATTLPEKFVAVLGGARRQPGILVANTVGSNIFLVTLCGGVLLLAGTRRRWPGFHAGGGRGRVGGGGGILGVVLVGARRWMGVVMLGRIWGSWVEVGMGGGWMGIEETVGFCEGRGVAEEGKGREFEVSRACIGWPWRRDVKVYMMFSPVTGDT
ncbi:hypothetical protein NEMBOFW57_004307 [Staphylotrichum longicolle]|uniref:Sodium/calcium exchanger membrane region domain-containing protein n=1 Tax=Staphylotrichum longicolle TaxID=669026 RepID=A0AAD4F6W6_9PEZI|nr:hypothetical protein NEMBOFW57_004307 [Staphylotrichum longicolle]